MVTSDDQHIGLQRSDRWHGRIELFNAFDLLSKVAILTRAVGVFE